MKALYHIKSSTKYNLQQFYKHFTNMIFHTLYYAKMNFSYNESNEIVIGFFSSWYGGNIKAILKGFENWLSTSKINSNISFYFSSVSKEQVNIAKKDGVTSFWYHDLKAIPYLSNTKIVVTTHGERILPFSRRKKFWDIFKDLNNKIIQKMSLKPIQSDPEQFAIKRIEIWHGIPYKDVIIDKPPINPNIFCVTSEFVKNQYAKKGYNKDIFRITGYPRNDVLFTKFDKTIILNEFGLPSKNNMILYAPTCDYGKNREIFPWDNQLNLIKEIGTFCEKTDSLFLIRPHILWKTSGNEAIENIIGKCKNIQYLPMNEFPDIYPLLTITDVLITDWSSIAFDFMLLRKPIIFIDCPNPCWKILF